MKKAFFSLLAFCSAMSSMADAQVAADFESGAIPEGWTVSVPESPYTGGYSVVTYASQTALKAQNVGTNNLGGTNVLLSKTGATNAVKGNSDNWLTSPAFTVGTDNVFTFRLAANCSYSPTKTAEAEKMKMDVVVIEGENKTVVSTIAPENYFSWKQYAIDLSAYNGKSIQIAFHDYGTAGSGAVAEMKFIDNIQLTSTKSTDYSILAVTTLYGQAEYTAPYTIQVANYGCAKENFTVKYQIGDAEPVAEVIDSTLSAGKTMSYTFKTAPLFEAGKTLTFKVWVEAADDAMPANDSLAVQTITTASKQALPYAVANELNDESTDNDDLVQNEFATATGSTSNAKWAYDAVKYNAWIYTHKKADAKYQGVGYLYTTKAYSLPAGKVVMKTIGTATLTDNYYEVYIAKYGAKGMADYATKVGQSDTLRNVVETTAIDTTTVELTIPEAGDYIIGIRPMTKTANAQMTIIGLSLEVPAPEPLKIVAVTPADSTEMSNMTETFTVTFNDDSNIGYGKWRVVNTSLPEDDENYTLTTGQLLKKDGVWGGKAYFVEALKMYAGINYQLEVYPYTSEEESNYESAQYAGALCKLVAATWKGTTKAYTYATAELESLTPSSDATIVSGTITAVFTAAVDTLSATINGGIVSNDAKCETTPSEDKKTWTIVIPQNIIDAATGGITMNVYAKDAEGKVVKGNAGEDENSYFVWEFNCYNACPTPATITPASGSTVEKIDTIFINEPAGIAFSYSASTDILVTKGMETLFAIPTDSVKFEEVELGQKCTNAIICLPEAITAVGNYQVIFPAKYFMIGEEFSSVVSKNFVVEYTIEDKNPQPSEFTYTVDPAEGEVETLSIITLTFPGLTEAGVGSGKVTVNKDGEEIDKVDMVFGLGLNQLDLYYTTKTPGLYTFVVPEGYVVDQTGAGQPGFTLTYTVTVGSGDGGGGNDDSDKVTEISFITDPADGSNVTEIKKILYTFNNVFTADMVNASAGTVTNAAGESAVTMTMISWGEGTNQLVLECTPITADGVYTITLPAGSITLDGKATGVDVVITLTIGTADGIKNIAVSGIKNGKFMVNGETVIVRDGKNYTTAGQLIK